MRGMDRMCCPALASQCTHPRLCLVTEWRTSRRLVSTPNCPNTAVISFSPHCSGRPLQPTNIRAQMESQGAVQWGGGRGVMRLLPPPSCRGSERYKLHSTAGCCNPLAPGGSCCEYGHRGIAAPDEHVGVASGGREPSGQRLQGGRRGAGGGGGSAQRFMRRRFSRRGAPRAPVRVSGGHRAQHPEPRVECTKQRGAACRAGSCTTTV